MCCAESDVVRHLSFTGHRGWAASLMAPVRRPLKKLSLELGGNAPFIVFDDADLDAAVDGAIANKYRNAGQTCVCANRLYVQAGVYDAFVAKFAAKVATLKPGRSGVRRQVSPLIDAQALAKVETHVADAMALGAKGGDGRRARGRWGQFFQPTVLANTPARRCCAPAKPSDQWRRSSSSRRRRMPSALANATEFGLASYFYSRDIARVFRVAEALEYGMVGINTGLIATARAPLAGSVGSGLGRERTKASRNTSNSRPSAWATSGAKASTKSRKGSQAALAATDAKGAEPPAGLESRRSV